MGFNHLKLVDKSGHNATTKRNNRTLDQKKKEQQDC